MKPFITLLILTMFAANASGTAQVPDRIIVDGTTHMLHSNPLEPYFAEHPDKRTEGEVLSTACWRGYIATFEVKEDILLLADIAVEVREEDENGEHSYSLKSVKDQLVAKGETLEIDWFNGLLVIPHGKRFKYVHMGYGSTFSNYVLIEIKKGKLTGKRDYDYKAYEQFKTKQYEAYKKTEAYQKQAADLRTEDWTQEQIDRFLRSFVVSYTSEFLVEDEEDTDASASHAKEEENEDDEKK